MSSGIEKYIMRPDPIIISDISKSKEPKTLVEKAKNIVIGRKEKSKIMKEQVWKAIADSLPVPGLIKCILRSTSDYEEEIDKLKKEKLIERYLNNFDSLEEAVKKLERLLTNPCGLILWSKINRLIHKQDTKENLEIVGSALTYIVNRDFESQFDEHLMGLEIIERLSPQALLLLKKHKDYPGFTYFAAQLVGEPVEPNWIWPLSEKLISSWENNNSKALSTVCVAFYELYREGLIDKMFIPGGRNSYMCILTEYGESLYEYLDF